MASPSKKDRYPLSNSSRRDWEREKLEKERGAVAVATERLKTVVRRLPANLPEEVFWQSVQQWVTDESVLWKVFYPGKAKKRINKENIPSRAYIAFKNEELVAQFSRDYDGHIFRDKQGNESQAIVEFAPYQKIPPDKKKADARNATIEKDEDYVSFMASLNQAEKVEPVSLESLIAANQPPPMPKTTPLLEALKAEKFGIKDKDAMLRNYKDATILQSTSLPRNLATTSTTKDDASGKKKAAQPPPTTLAKDSAQSDSGKKGKKSQAAAAKQQQGPTHPGPVSNATKKDPPPFKPHKVARQQAAAAKLAAAATQVQAQAQASSQRKVEEASPVSASSSGDGSATVAPATGGVAAQVSAAAASRRARPVLGVASRQLQAALSQVGASAMERKRREREAEKGTSPISPEGVGNSSPIVAEGTSGKGKEPEKAISTTSSAISPPPSENSNVSGKEIRERPKQTPPTSPRHDRTKRREKSGHQADFGVKVPSIMQRPDGMPPPASQRDAPGQVLPSAVQVQAQIPAMDGQGTGAPGPANPPSSRGGPRRGRSRGRGYRGG